jgi:hypothetical protein
MGDPSVAPINGAVLTITTSDGAVPSDPAVGRTPLLLSVPAGGPAAGQQPKFDLPDGHSPTDYQWVFHDRFGGGEVWTITPRTNPNLCLTDFAAVTLQPCGGGQGQDFGVTYTRTVDGPAAGDVWFGCNIGVPMGPFVIP